MDEIPSSGQHPTENNLVSRSDIENQSQYIREPEDPFSQRLMRPTIRRVISQIDLHRIFDAYGRELGHSDSQLCHKNELAELKQDHENEVKALKAENDKQIQAMEAEKSAFQKRIEELESGKATVEADLESKQVTVLHLVAISQSLQDDNDKLKERCTRIADESESNHSALEHQTAATHAAVEERKMVEQELGGVFNASRTLATSLATAQNHAMFCERRMIELSYAMVRTPNEVANMRGVIEQKDKLFSDLEKRAGECFTALAALEEKSGEEKDIACREIAVLRAELGNNNRTIADLRTSRDGFQHQCEAVFAMLMNEVGRDDLINAMDGYFQTAIQDNAVLKTEVDRLISELSSQNLQLASLQTAIREAERSLKVEKDSSNQLKLTSSAKDAELNALHIKLDSLTTNHQSLIEEKEGQLADAEWRLSEAYDATVELMTRGRDERERFFIQRKDDKIAALERKCQEQSSSFNLLEQYVRTQADVSAQNAEAACLTQAALEESLGKLAAAQEQIENQKKLFQAQLKFRASLKNAEILAMKEDLGTAQGKIQELEHQLRASHDPASAQDPVSRGVDDDDLYGVSDQDQDGEKSDDEDISFF